MNSIYIFEALWFILLGVCIYGEMRKRFAECDFYRLLELCLTIPYGLFLEYWAMQTVHPYTYGSFALMIGSVPLSIAVGWSVIIYTAMNLSDRLKIREWCKPVSEAVIAVLFDLVLDPICVALGYWQYNVTIPVPRLLGVPLQNFFGWFLIVLSYGGWVRLTRIAFTGKLKRTFSGPFLACLLSALTFILISYLLELTVQLQ